jgi:hypothetical protein
MIELCDGSRQTYFSACVRSEPIGLERGRDTEAQHFESSGACTLN